MTVARTSRQAYEELIASGKAATQRGLILKAMLRFTQGLSRRSLARVTGLEINAVCGRVNELVKDGVLREDREVRCVVTGKMVSVVEPVLEQQQEMEF